MGVSDFVGEKLSISEPSARFLLALYAAYPVSIVYRLLLAQQHPRIKNAYLSLSGMAITYYILGTNIWHSAADVLSVYLLLSVCGGTLVSVILTWLLVMGHLMYGYVVAAMSGEIHQISWRIPHCVLVLKLIGLSYNLYDSRKKESELSEDMKSTAVAEAPSLLEITGFSYFHGSVLAGPQLSFRRYRDFVNGDLFDWNKTPSSVPAGVRRLLVGVALSALYSLLNQWFPLSTVISDQFNDHVFPVRLLLMVVCGKVALWRYVTVWLIAEGSCILTGISYNGVDKSGSVDWYGLSNIHLFKTETSITLQGIIDSFNINTNKWIALYVFKRLRFLGSKTLSFLISLVFVSLWHGVWPGYALCFSLEFMLIFAERSFISFMKWLLGGSLSEFSLPIRALLTLGAFALRNVLLFYPLILFMLLSWELCFKFMSSVYFMDHIVVVVWCVLFYTVLVNVIRKPRPKKEE